MTANLWQRMFEREHHNMLYKLCCIMQAECGVRTSLHNE